MIRTPAQRAGLCILLAPVLLLGSGCARKTDSDTAYAKKYKALMVAWKGETQAFVDGLDGRIAPIPRPERRAFLVTDMRNEAAIHERMLGRLDALGTPPPVASEMVAASRAMLSFLARSSRERANAIERRDRTAMAGLDREFDVEIKRIGKRLVAARNAAAKQAGMAEIGEVDFFGGAEK